MANEVKKLHPGMAVVYRLTAYSMVRTGELLDRNASKDGWLVRDDGDRRQYELRDGIARIRVPDEPRQLEVYRRHNRVVGACAGRVGVLPNRAMDTDLFGNELDEKAEEERMFGAGSVSPSLFSRRFGERDDEEEDEVEIAVANESDAAGISGEAAKAIEEKLAK